VSSFSPVSSIQPGRRRRLPRRVINTIILALVALYFLFPLWWLLTSSTKSLGELSDSPDLGFGANVVNNVTTLFGREGGIFLRWLGNGLLYAGVGAVFGTLVSVMAGYVFAKYQFAKKEWVFNFVLVGVLVPPTVLALPLFLMLSGVGLTNTYWAVLVPSIVSPFGVYLARINASAAIPDEILEAARIDGAGELRLFASVGVRLMGPALVTLFLFQFAAIWNNFLLPLVMLSDRNLYPATLGLYSWTGLFIQDPTLSTSVVTGSMISVLPVVIAFVVLERYLRSGAAVGSIK
jgi:multiple sugar transport system permease protein